MNKLFLFIGIIFTAFLVFYQKYLHDLLYKQSNALAYLSDTFPKIIFTFTFPFLIISIFEIKKEKWLKTNISTFFLFSISELLAKTFNNTTINWYEILGSLVGSICNYIIIQSLKNMEKYK